MWHVAEGWDWVGIYVRPSDDPPEMCLMYVPLPANSPDGKAQNLDMLAIIDKAFGQPDMPSEYV
mgnify:CR=1 FL=1